MLLPFAYLASRLCCGCLSDAGVSDCARSPSCLSRDRRDSVELAAAVAGAHERRGHRDSFEPSPQIGERKMQRLPYESADRHKVGRRVDLGHPGVVADVEQVRRCH